jgi:hypothetical protein
MDTVAFNCVWGNRTILLGTFLSKQGEEQGCKTQPSESSPATRPAWGVKMAQQLTIFSR